MTPISRPVGAWRRGALIACAVLALPLVTRGEAEPPRLYRSAGDWAVTTGLPATVSPPLADWRYEDGRWIGRIPEELEEIRWGEVVLPVAEALSPPLAPGVLPPVRNAFGPCVVRSLSVRFESQIRAHRWSLVFAKEGQEPEFVPLQLAEGPPVPLDLWLEDVDTGGRWELRPERMGREGGMFEQEKGEARLYAGMLDNDQVEWHLVVARSPAGRRILQARIRTFSPAPRRFRLRVSLRTGAPGQPVLQDDLPPAVVAVRNDLAVALFMDRAEPRRYRAILDDPDRAGLEFDLAVTRATGNFPRSATISVEVDAWITAGPAAVMDEAMGRFAPLSAGTPLSAEVLRDRPGAIPVFAPARLTLSHPGGFHDAADVLHYLMLRMSGLFEDADWSSSGFLCNALDADGQPRIRLEGERAVLEVNADPDLETMLEMGQNRGQVVLDHVLRSGAPAVWIRAAGETSGLDHHVRALYLCDYPALWEDDSPFLGVDLRHAEAELLASLACVLNDRGIGLLVSDSGPMAPFTTAHADALVCESADPAEMRRQHALAGGRPVVWMPEEADAAARALAQELAFVFPGNRKED